jgi:hypothetical protein
VNPAGVISVEPSAKFGRFPMKNSGIGGDPRMREK